MRKTEHYELNQWDLSDEIRMEDFNKDNAAVDAALAALAAIAGKGDHVQILEQGAPDPKGSYTILFPQKKGVNWSDYWMVMYFHIIRPSASSPNTKITFSTNITDHDIPYGIHMVVFFPMHNAGQVPFHYLLLSGNTIEFVTDTGYDRPCDYLTKLATEAVPDSGHYNSGGYMLLGFK